MAVLAASEPETLFASLSAVLMDLEASSMFVMLPFLRPCALQTPAPVMEMDLSLPTSAIIAHIFVEPISMAKIVLLNLESLDKNLSFVLALKVFNQPFIKHIALQS